MSVISNKADAYGLVRAQNAGIEVIHFAKKENESRQEYDKRLADYVTTKQPDFTREKILQAAFCEIHRQGFQAASIANILQDTGMTKGALYHHFPTKQALGLAVIDEVIKQRLDGVIFRPLRESDRPVEMLPRPGRRPAHRLRAPALESDEILVDDPGVVILPEGQGPPHQGFAPGEVREHSRVSR